MLFPGQVKLQSFLCMGECMGITQGKSLLVWFLQNCIYKLPLLNLKSQSLILVTQTSLQEKAQIVLAVSFDWYERKSVHEIKYFGLYCPLYKQETEHDFYTIFEVSGRKLPSIPTIRFWQKGVTFEEVHLKRLYLGEHKRNRIVRKKNGHFKTPDQTLGLHSKLSHTNETKMVKLHIENNIVVFWLHVTYLRGRHQWPHLDHFHYLTFGEG